MQRSERLESGEELSKVRHDSILISKKGLTTELPIHTCNNPKSPLMQPQQKRKKGKPLTGAIMVLITLLLLGEKYSLFFTIVKNGVPGVFPLKSSR